MKNFLNFTSSQTIVILDPLEQFAINNLMFAPEEYDGSYLVGFRTHTWACPYDILAFGANSILYFNAYVNMIYFHIHYYLLSFWLNSVLVIILACCLLTIINAYEIEKTNNNPIEILPTTLTTFVQQGFILSWFFKTVNAVVKTILKSNTHLEKKEFFFVLYFLFLLITLCNIAGLIPYTFTLTSSFIITFFFAATHFIGINIIALYKNNWNFFNMFLPSGVPLAISPFLVLIELISYIAKVFSLSIRLFANMMAGHALLKILIGFSWMMFSTCCPFLAVPAFLPWFVVTAILFLEILIAFLQSYVFTVLIAIYINDVFNAH